MNRREFIRRMVVSSALVVTGAVAISEIIVRMGAGQGGTESMLSTVTTGTRTQQVTTPQGYVFVAPVASLSGKTSAYFNHPSGGESILVNLGSQWKAFGATCTHQPCTVQYSGGPDIVCPCHGATFSTSDGSVLGGPAPTPIPEYGVQVQNGNLFVTVAAIN